jgi:hypothetical protein
MIPQIVKLGKQPEALSERSFVLYIHVGIKKYTTEGRHHSVLFNADGV